MLSACFDDDNDDDECYQYLAFYKVIYKFVDAQFIFYFSCFQGLFCYGLFYVLLMFLLSCFGFRLYMFIVWSVGKKKLEIFFSISFRPAFSLCQNEA